MPEDFLKQLVSYQFYLSHANVALDMNIRNGCKRRIGHFIILLMRCIFVLFRCRRIVKQRLNLGHMTMVYESHADTSTKNSSAAKHIFTL